MKNLFWIDKKLDLEELFTNDEIKFLKKEFPKINILMRASPSSADSQSNVNDSTKYKSELNKQENKKDKIYVYKKYFYKLILENAKTKYEQEENTIMLKSLSYLIEDLFNENNSDEINSKEILIYNNENNKKISFNKMKQMSTLSLPEKNINEI